MRTVLGSLFYRSPFKDLQKHADKVKECAQLFREAAGCHMNEDYKRFDVLTDQVALWESEADGIKRNIRNHLPRGILMPVDKFQLFDYLREQDKVLDELEEALFWLSFRPKAIPDAIKADFSDLVNAVIPATEKLPELVTMATVFFKNRTEDQRKKIKSLIYDIRQDEKKSDTYERDLKRRIFRDINDALAVYHLIRLVEIVGNIADHAQNASDRMRAMIAR
jgi:uncharacterized protein